MKSYSLLTLALLSVAVLVSSGGVGYAEAYDGKIDGSPEFSQYIEGDIVKILGHVKDAEPIPDEKIQIVFVERSTGNTIFTDEIEIELTPIIAIDKELWTFEYILDTSNTILMPETIYDVALKYDDIMEDFDFDFRAGVAQQVVSAGQLMKDSETSFHTIPL